MKTEYKVSIDADLSEKVEHLFYQYNAGRDIIAFLMKDEDVRHDLLQDYINITEVRFTELEMMKNKVGERYCPDFLRVSKKPYNFEFLFDECAIRYEVKDA